MTTVAGGTRRGALPVAAYAALLFACTALSLTWLAAGALVAVAARVPPLAAALDGAAAGGDQWAQGLVAALPTSGPGVQVVLDHGFSLLTLVLAGVLIAGHDRSWSIRLLVLAMVGSAGAFNLEAHAAATAVEVATGLPVGTMHKVLLHGVACAAYIVALLVFPADREFRSGGAARTVLVLAGTGTLLLVGVGTALLPHTTSCVLFFGFLVPLVGLAVLRRRIRSAPTATARTQSRLLFSVLGVAFAVAAVLAVITGLLWTTGWTSMVLIDPTAHPGEPGSGEPMTLLFWFSRLACIGVAGAVYVAVRRDGLWTAERLFSRGLAAGLTAALVGGGYVVVHRTAAYLLDGGAFVPWVLATVPAALALLPVYVRAERLTEQLLFGTRPTPYRVLAGITALSRGTATDAPDLARVAEAVGRGLGATTCRLTVTRPGLRDRSYTWTDANEHDPDDLVEVVVRHGAEAIGTLAVDYAAVAGLQHQRQHLLEDVADSLGVVLQASRSGIELERQLRAALAHANEIAASRRAVVAEMDSERRRIERDLHDGAQHHLVSLRLALGLLEHQVSTAQFDNARTRLEQVADQIDMVESILAETAMGVSTPLLAEAGLVRALGKELASGQPPVAVDASGVAEDARFPRDVESAVYFCCLEAVNNARKHAGGAAIDVRLLTEDGRLRFTVQDDGPGWDQARAAGSPGRGLRNVTTRISAVGGRVEVRSAPGQGTAVEGSVPLPSEPDETAPIRRVPPVDVPAPAGGQGVPALATAGVLAAAQPLVDQVRDAVRAARELYHGTGRADALRALAEGIDSPLRIAVSDGDGAAAALVAALEALDPDEDPASELTRPVLVAAPADRPDPQAAAYVLLLRRDADGEVLLPPPRGSVAPHPAHVIGALLHDGPIDETAEREAARCAARGDVLRRCHVVVPVAPALAGVPLSEEQFRGLQDRAARDCGPSAGAVPGNGAVSGGAVSGGAVSGEGAVSAGGAPPRAAAAAGAGAPAQPSDPAPAVAMAVTGAAGEAPAVERSAAGAPPVVRTAGPPAPELPEAFGPAVVRFAVAAIRSGHAPTREALAAALVQCSGLHRLRELVAERLVPRADALTARSVLIALEELVRTDPPPAGGDALRYLLDRIRSGATDLSELDVLDALRAGEVDLPDEDRRVAERLLGAAGPAPRARLGLAPDARPQEVLRAAGEQLAHWQRRAANPPAGMDVRNLADGLVQVCERLLAGAGER